MDNAPSKLLWRNRLKDLKRERSDYEAQWRDIAEHMAPGRLRRYRTDRENVKGKKHQKIIDETALRARRVFVAGFVSGMTSPARPWFKLTTSDRDMVEFHAVKVWLEEVERRINLVLSSSNFYQAIPQVYDDLGTFGTCAMGVTESVQSGAWFYAHPVGEWAISSNDQHIVDVFYRETSMSVAQIAQRFGVEAMSPTTKTLWDTNRLETRVPVVQAIEPNDERNDKAMDWRRFPYRSVWFEEKDGADNYLGKSGFAEFPVMCGRWYATAADDYGIDCPGMTALGGVKQLQHQQMRKAQAIDLMVRPPISAPSSMRKSPMNLLPGGVNYHDAAGPGDGIKPIYELQPRIDYMLNDIAEVQHRINESWFVDMFLMISQQDDVRTATEVALRNEEKLLVLGPALQRVQTEILDPCIERVFNILLRADALPEIPQELEGEDLRVEYISMLAQAQQSVGASSIERFLGATGNIAALNPEVIDKVDFDAALDEYGQILGVPSRLVRSDEDADEIRQGRAQAQAQQQAAQMAGPMRDMAQAAKTASEIDVSEESALQRLTSGV